jgi:glutaredoxin
MYLVLGRRNCPFCDKAKERLEQEGLPYVYVDIMETQEKTTLFKDILVNKMNVNTVPQVFKLVGGYGHLKDSLDG